MAAESFLMITDAEHTALANALSDLGTQWAFDLLTDCSYLAPGYPNTVWFVRVSALDDDEQDWLLENDFYFDAQEFLLSQYFSAT